MLVNCSSRGANLCYPPMQSGRLTLFATSTSMREHCCLRYGVIRSTCFALFADYAGPNINGGSGTMRCKLRLTCRCMTSHGTPVFKLLRSSRVPYRCTRFSLAQRLITRVNVSRLGFGCLHVFWTEFVLRWSKFLNLGISVCGNTAVTCRGVAVRALFTTSVGNDSEEIFLHIAKKYLPFPSMQVR